MATDPIQAEDANVLTQAEQVAHDAALAPRLCLVCDNPVPDGHKYPIGPDCWEKLGNCSKCGEKKGYFNPKTKQHHSLCTSCFRSTPAAPKKTKPALAPAPVFKPNTAIEHLWARLRRAHEILSTQIVKSSPFADELAGFLAKAEDACDREDTQGFNQNLNDFFAARKGVDTWARLQHFDLEIPHKKPEYLDTDWALVEMYIQALNSFDVGNFVGAEQHLDGIIGLLEFERAEVARLENLNRQVEELQAKWAKAKEDAKRVADNREARLAYLAQQLQTPAPTEPQTTLQNNRPALVLDQICENCGGPSKYRFCIDCHKRLPDCPSCGERKVHVDRSGYPKENCLQCFRATLSQTETYTARKPQPTSTYRDAQWRARKLETSQAGPKGLIMGDTSKGGGKGKNRK